MPLPCLSKVWSKFIEYFLIYIQLIVVVHILVKYLQTGHRVYGQDRKGLMGWWWLSQSYPKNVNITFVGNTHWLNFSCKLNLFSNCQSLLTGYRAQKNCSHQASQKSGKYRSLSFAKSFILVSVQLTLIEKDLVCNWSWVNEYCPQMWYLHS